MLAADPEQAAHWAKMADEFGELDAQVRLHAPIKNRHEALRKRFQDAFDSLPAAQDYKIEGTKTIVLVSARKHQTLVNIVHLHKILGLKALLQIAKVTIEDIKRKLTSEEFNAITSSVQTGSRTVQAVPKNAG